jgi:acetoin utilization deacetylase AcuC-like enzyme
VSTAYISHNACLDHDTGAGHPENERRLSAINDRMIASGLFDVIRHYDAPEATAPQLLRVHTQNHLDQLRALVPAHGYTHIDPDTVISPDSLQAALHAAGAAVLAVDLIIKGEIETAFCCVRPPGHHAERERAMGFCLFNNIAVGAAHALEEHGLQKVAIVDFDVHHGNGTEDIFKNDERVLFCSTFEHPLYPFTELLENTANRVNVPLPTAAGSAEFRAAVTDHWLPALDRFQPQMLFISAGFDAHRDDDMSSVCLADADFSWVTGQILDVARKTAEDRIVSALEGGYEINSLVRCVENHVRLLMGLS